MRRFKPIHLIPILSILSALAIGATIQRAVVVLNFNAGELSPTMEGRADFAKYNSGARELQNMLVRSQGPVTRRPGTKYIATVKDSNDPTRLIPFEYSTEDAYILEMGDDYLRFYRNGTQVLDGNDPYEVNAPWDSNDLFEIQYAQDAQVMRFVHPDYPPYKLIRNTASHTDWTLAAVDFNDGPFIDENDDKAITVTPSAVTGTITLTASDDIFDTNDVNGLWEVTHIADSNSISGTFYGGNTVVAGDVAAVSDEGSDGDYECNSVGIKVYRYQEYTVTSGGYWIGKFIIQRSYDDGTTWDDVKAFAYSLNGNVLYTGSEQNDDAVYRVRIEDQSVSAHMYKREEGICTFTVATDSFMRHGVVKITEVNDVNLVTGTVETELDSNNATWRWAEGAWSTYRGWPRTIEFHEQRCCYGGNAAWPQTIWASITASEDDDYDDFDEGEGLAADAWTYVLPGMNPIQWMVSAEYLMVGTTEGVGRLGSPDKPIDPTWPPVYRLQARNGCAYIDAAAAMDAILYVERGAQNVREVTYTYSSDRYVAPDMTILAEHIARKGIVQIDFQDRPDPILWCVRADGVLLSFTYQRTHEVLAWARHITGQDPNDLTSWDDFESVAVIPGTSNRADGTARNDDEVWVVVKRTVDSNEVRYVEQFQSMDWGDDPNYCWFVDCGGYGTSAGAGALSYGTQTPASDAPEWTETQPEGDADSDWYEVAISGDGTKVLAGGDPNLYLSDDSGDNWAAVALEVGSDHQWYITEISEDGETMMAGCGSGRLYLSTDGGANWAETQPAGDTAEVWTTGAMSSDGATLFVGTFNTGADGRLYLSTDTGSSWNEAKPAGEVERYWLRVGMDSTGTTLLAAAKNVSSQGKLYLSTDSGGTWAETQPAGAVTRDWYIAEVSGDGNTLLAGCPSHSTGKVYISTDDGVTWTEHEPHGITHPSYWYTGSINDDGQRILVGMSDLYHGSSYYTDDGGTTWTMTEPRETTPDFNGVVENAQWWFCSAMSPDGDYLALGENDTGRLYVGTWTAGGEVEDANKWDSLTWGVGLAACVYADGRPVGTFDVDANGVVDLNEVCTVCIAGLNYYSILETMPLVDAETIGRPTAIKSVAVDFLETMGAHVGSDMDHASDWTFSIDDFNTAIDPYTGYKPPTGYSPFMRGMTRQPVVYIYEYDPIPMTIRSITANMEMTFE